MPKLFVCPKCHRPVALPPTVPPASVLRCPLCLAKCRGEQLRDFKPPEFMILPDPGGVLEAEMIPGEATVLEDELPPMAIGPATTSSEPDTDAYVLQQDVQPEIGIRRSSAARTTHRRRSNVGGEIAKVLLGGVGGLLIGYAVLIWGLHTDPFGLTQFLPSVILPDRLAGPQP